MELVDVLIHQYGASLKMLENVIVRSSEALWLDERYTNRCWSVVYHTLFYTHLYVQTDAAAFHPWAYHRENYNRLPQTEHPYTQAQMLDYLNFCRAEVAAQIPQQDLAGPSGFEWLAMSKCELHLYTIRHIMQHTGELSDRLGQQSAAAVEWVSTQALPG